MKRIGAMALAVMLMMVISFTFTGCERLLGIEEYESGYFKYQKGDNEVATISGLTKLGSHQKVIVVPEKIDGRTVVSLKWQGFYEGGRWESEVLEKVFIPKNMNVFNAIFRGCVKLKRVIINDIGDEEPNSISFIGTIYLNKIHYAEVSHISNFKCANISFYYNYENAPNNNYCWIDDVDYGTKIEMLPPEPTREGYKFEGWYKEVEGNNKWDFADDTLPTEKLDEEGKIIYQETELFAKWIKE